MDKDRDYWKMGKRYFLFLFVVTGISIIIASQYDLIALRKIYLVIPVSITGTLVFTVSMVLLDMLDAVISKWQRKLENLVKNKK